MKCWKTLILSGMLLAGRAAAADCQEASTPNPLGATLAAIALQEYAQFNGHRINEAGYLWKFGATESEFTLLRDADTGQRDPRQSGRYAWRRVWQYWQSLARHVNGATEDRMLLYAPQLLDAPDEAGPRREFRLSELLQAARAIDADASDALRQAAVRAAMNDTPWSAAFISHVMDRAGLDASQFRFSAAHWQYVQPAFAPTPDYAYVACDARRSRPAVGDLLCHARGSSPLKRFADWRAAAAQPGFSTPAHCELVTAVDHAARKMEVVGGNVLSSVARRRLKLNEANLLSASHDPDRVTKSANAECARDKDCDAPNLNLQYWSVLLKLRPTIHPVRGAAER
jgi:hypothetical protein